MMQVIYRFEREHRDIEMSRLRYFERQDVVSLRSVYRKLRAAGFDVEAARDMISSVVIAGKYMKYASELQPERRFTEEYENAF